jgi:hypothetical protein
MEIQIKLHPQYFMRGELIQVKRNNITVEFSKNTGSVKITYPVITYRAEYPIVKPGYIQGGNVTLFKIVCINDI